MSSKPIKILLIDDDEDEFFILSELIEDFGSNARVEWAANFEQGLELMLREKHDVYFVDYRLGAKSGIDLFYKAKESGFTHPVILLTGQGNRDIDMEALEGGFADYLTKNGLSAEQLERSLRYTINRYKSQQKLIEEKWRYTNLFEYSMDPIVLCKLDFEVYECNQVFQELIGKEITDTETVRFEDFIFDQDELVSFKEQLRSEGSLEDFEISIESVKGPRECLCSAVHLMNSNNEAEGFQVIFHDMTDIRAAARESQIAAQMTFTGKIAQLIAHEVRNPLTNINLAVDQFADIPDPSDEDKSLYFDMIKRNSNRINNLISQILDSSKPTTLSKSEIHLTQVIQDALEHCEDRLNLHEVQVTLDINDAKNELSIDGEKLSLAIVNIITNAIEAMSETLEPLLKITSDIAINESIIRITDNGKGMTPEQASKVFEPFFSSRRGGKGLGMTLTKNVVDAHGGKIDVESKPFVGTTFIITLPY